MQIRELLGFGPSRKMLAAENQQLTSEVAFTKTAAMAYARESMMMALSLAFEDRDWISTDGFSRDAASTHLTFAAITKAAANGAALVQGNPIMRSAAVARAAYIWGEGVRITGADKLMKRKRNRRALFSEDAMQQLQFAKIGTGNIFVLCEGRDATIIPFYEIRGAVYDTQDPSFIQYFYREWEEKRTDFATGATITEKRKMYYANADFEVDTYPDEINSTRVYPLGVIKHGAPNRLPGAAWGIPDLIAGIFYAAEHKELIEAGDSIFRAQSQYAVQYKTKTQRALENVAASIAAPPTIDPFTGEAQEYGQTVAFGSDIEMQLMNKIGGGIDFAHFDPIAALATTSLAIPLDVVLGKMEASDTSLPFSTIQTMKIEQRWWQDFLTDVLEELTADVSKVQFYWPKINPDPTHRQIQSIVGLAKLRVASPKEVRKLARDTFGADWDEALPDPSEWDDYFGVANAPVVAPGSTEPTITPGQGQSGQLGKLADGDHELRDEGLQQHTQQ